MSILDFSFSGGSSGGLGLSAGSGGLGLKAPEINDTYSPGAVDYSLGSGGTTPGLQAPGSWGGNLGFDLNSSYGGGFTPDYALGSQFNLAQLGQPNLGLQSSGYEGLQAQASPASAGYALNAPTPGLGLAGTDPNFDPNRKGKDLLQMLLGVVPGGNLLNLGISALRGNNVLSGVLGAVGGLPGHMIGELFNAMNSRNPMQALGGSAARTGAGMLGSQLGGSAGGAALSSLVGNAMAQNDRNSFAGGPFGSGSPLDSPGGVAAQPGDAQGGDSGFGWNWGTAEKLLQLGSGIYGMKLAGDQRKAAEQAMQRSDPWGTSGGRGIADAQLRELMTNPAAMENDPAFKARIRGAQRATAQYGQDSGAMSVAGANAATDWYNSRLQQLGALAGAGTTPGNNSAAGLQGIAQANELAGSSLASLGYGVSSQQTQQQQALMSLLLAQQGGR